MPTTKVLKLFSSHLKLGEGIFKAKKDSCLHSDFEMLEIIKENLQKTNSDLLIPGLEL